MIPFLKYVEINFSAHPLPRNYFGSLTISIFFFCFGSGVAHANKIVIPDARPVNTASVEMWKLNSNLSRMVNGSDSVATSGQIPLASLEEKTLNGVTDFLLDRAQQEARLYLEEQMNNELCKSTEAKYFQNTCRTISQLNGSNYSMSGASVMLRASIQDDLRNYPDLYLDQQNDPKWIQARYAIAIFKEVRSSRDIGEIIGGIGSACEGKDKCTNVIKNIENSAKVYWVLSENLRALRMFLNKAYYENRPAAIGKVVAATLANQSLQYIFNTPEKKKTAEDRLIQIVDLIEVVQNCRTQIEAFQVKESRSDIYDAGINIRVRATLTGINTLYLISKVLDDASPLDEFQEVTNLAQAIIEEDYARIVFETNALFISGDGGKQNKLLPLMVELASARSSADVQKILEVAAAPAGSYREKFKSDSLLTITALAGAGFGKERYANGANSNDDYRPLLTAGLQFTKNVNDCGKIQCGVIGAYVSVIDLGPFAAQRNNSGNVSNSSNTGWAQALSPGLYLTWNPPFAKSFVLGYGISTTPNLVTSNTGEQVGATRRQLFIAIDMTLFAYR